VPGYRASVKACPKLYLTSPRVLTTRGGPCRASLAVRRRAVGHRAGRSADAVRVRVNAPGRGPATPIH
jgi:hypothetical protein